MASQWTWRPDHRLATLSHGFAAGSPTGAVTFTYGYDASWRVTSIGNTRPQAFEWQPTLGYARTYVAVNALNQVASETQGSVTRANAFDDDANMGL